MLNSQSEQKSSAEVVEDTGHNADERLPFHHPTASTTVTEDPFVSLMSGILNVSKPFAEGLTDYFVHLPRQGQGQLLTHVV